MNEFEDRHLRQKRLAGFGEEGQRRLRESRVLVVGCGALGTVVSEQLVRAGVGTVTIVDRDIVDVTNLQRQTLFTTRDAERRVPKAEAAKARLAQVDPGVAVRAIVDDVHAGNALRYCADHDLVVDCLDNFETRYVLNDCAVSLGIPLVYGGAVGFRGMAAVLLPVTGAERRVIAYDAARAGPCLRCLAPQPPEPGEVETCDSVGVLSSAAGIAASLEAGFALRLLAETPLSVEPALVRFDLATGSFSSASLLGARDPDCSACGRRVFEFLAQTDRHGATGDSGDFMASRPRVLCGRNAVEIPLGAPLSPASRDRIAARMAACGEVRRESFGGSESISCAWSEPTGARSLVVVAATDSTRALVGGSDDPEVARSVVARVLG
ncbi:MAG: ThiF family adenylyltransferase [Planctomycetaceae bacterium]|nr:ThiF family adenylyltransferase [Planctomycetaceae bacterium]